MNMYAVTYSYKVLLRDAPPDSERHEHQQESPLARPRSLASIMSIGKNPLVRWNVMDISRSRLLPGPTPKRALAVLSWCEALPGSNGCVEPLKLHRQHHTMHCSVSHLRDTLSLDGNRVHTACSITLRTPAAARGTVPPKTVLAHFAAELKFGRLDGETILGLNSGCDAKPKQLPNSF